MKSYNIILSRTDNIGDVVLTLPVAVILKILMPQCKIYFLGQPYTRPVIECCSAIDYFIDWNVMSSKSKKETISYIRNLRVDVIIHVFPKAQIAKLAKQSNIPLRIGTTNRLYHWTTCNKLIFLSRRRSYLHEVQLNIKLLQPLGAKKNYELDEIQNYYFLDKVKPLNANFKKLLSDNKFNLILHPKSKGSAREWGIDNFSNLVRILPKDRYRIFITGTKEEGDLIKESILNKHADEIVDLTGKMNLDELISFINESDGLIAASTGPLHIAAALKKTVIGIYPPIKPMHPGRWAPIGKNAHYMVIDRKCNKCRKNINCECISEIKPEEVKNKLLEVIS